MIKKIAVGTIILTFALTGCFAEKKEGEALKEADKAMHNDIGYLNARIKAVETVCLQLNEKINDLETRLERKGGRSEGAASVQKETSPEGSAEKLAASNAVPAESKGTEAAAAPATPEEPPAPANDSKPLKLTLGSFSYTISGMKLETIQKMFGKPDKVKKVANSETWIYSQINLQKDDGSPDPRPAMIVFENGRVAHGILTQEVQYDSQPEQTAQPAATNAATETKQ